jgi:hypothetical protein
MLNSSTESCATAVSRLNARTDSELNSVIKDERRPLARYSASSDIGASGMVQPFNMVDEGFGSRAIAAPSARRLT